MIVSCLDDRDLLARNGSTAGGKLTDPIYLV
jgi:hypothetical protein